MKPSLVVFQPAHSEIDTQIEMLLEHFCDSHYVYLIRPHCPLRDDSPAGIRFLGHSLNHLPDISNVDGVISVGDPQAAARLEETYPDSRFVVWDPEAAACLPDLFVSLLAPTLVRGDFRPAAVPDFARAM
ncbi:MAG: hypothetical protein ABIT37_15755 [Luteolibacter sp.]